MSEYDHEPVRGLPGALPEGERIIWQGAPDWKAMALSALHVRLAALYFAVVIAMAAAQGNGGVAVTMLLAAAGVIGFLVLFAYGVHRTTVYTLTNRRVVLRIGVALNKCINIPLGEIESANLKALGGDRGSIVLALKGKPRLGYVMLWPHARSLRVFRPQPMLRAIPEAQNVAQMLFEATRDVQPVEQASAQSSPDLEGLPA